MKNEKYRRFKISGEIWSPGEIWFFALHVCAVGYMSMTDISSTVTLNVNKQTSSVIPPVRRKWYEIYIYIMFVFPSVCISAKVPNLFRRKDTCTYKLLLFKQIMKLCFFWFCLFVVCFYVIRLFKKLVDTVEVTGNAMCKI